MLDIFTWAAVFLLGCLIALIVGAIFIAAVFYLQNGGRDD